LLSRGNPLSSACWLLWLGFVRPLLRGPPIAFRGAEFPFHWDRSSLPPFRIVFFYFDPSPFPFLLSPPPSPAMFECGSHCFQGLKQRTHFTYSCFQDVRPPDDRTPRPFSTTLLRRLLLLQVICVCSPSHLRLCPLLFSFGVLFFLPLCDICVLPWACCIFPRFTSVPPLSPLSFPVSFPLVCFLVFFPGTFLVRTTFDSPWFAL